ncbi:Plug domain-containing protein [Mucilaginibacter puniceus]
MKNKLSYTLKSSLCCLLVVFAAANGNAQVLDALKSNFKQYNDHVLQEKMYLHTDKNFYLTGEILWLKIYNVDAGLNTPLNISKVAYVDVLDEANNAVLQAKISLDKGTGNGSFYIPVTLKNGNYKLRAYTNWMKNFGPDVFFEKVITLVNPLTELAETPKETAKPASIQFFAESGTLLAGVTSTVGFKALGSDGKGAEINGVVINQRNDTVIRFQSLKFGMGSFTFTPEANSTYKAVVRIGRDNALINDLPAVLSKGYTIHVADADKPQPELKISARGNNSEPLYLFVHSGHQVVLAQSIITNTNGDASISIDKAKLGQGINHITIFNSARQPVCERLIFNRPKLLNLLGQVQTQYKTRSQVDINVSTNNTEGKATAANMSVSVFKLDSLNNMDDADIASYMWLGSELKGYIESPRYYFDIVTSETDKALDNLLLIQGWSRFKWNDVLDSKQKFTYLPEYDGHLITGQLNNATEQPAPGVKAYLGVIGKRLQLYGSVADSTGKLLFNTRQLFGPGEIVVQTNTEKDSSKYNITIKSPFAEQYGTSKLPPFGLDKRWQKALENTSLNMQVQNIYVPDKLKQYIDPMVDSSGYFGSNGKPYLLDDYTRFITMEEVLREYILEVLVSVRKNRVHFNLLSPIELYKDEDPMAILDGVPIFNLDKLFTVDPLKIRKLDMVDREFYWGPIRTNGVINLTSYKGDMAGFEIDPRAVVLDYEGMQLQREFYSPVYETAQQQKSRVPDFRNVLYWAPDVNTDAEGKAKVSFYTSDKSGKYAVILQGLTVDGQVGSYNSTFEVSK